MEREPWRTVEEREAEEEGYGKTEKVRAVTDC